MPFAVDPEVAKALAPMIAAMGDATPPPAGDIASRRAINEGFMAHTAAAQPVPGDVTITDYSTTASDGARLLLRWYAAEGAIPGPAVLYLHGGGMIMGSVDLCDAPLSRQVSRSGVPVLAVDYRLAPEHPYPAPAEDSYAGLAWLSGHAAELGADPARIALMGDSAGGGLAAAVALMARERGGPAPGRQILIYPMLDDRNTTPDPHLVPFAVWSYQDNLTAWGAVLGDAAGGPDVPAYAAPARAAELAGLPPAYVEVGQLDIFRDEDLSYALRLSQAGVPVEFDLHQGVPHEFDTYAFSTDVAADRLRVLKSL